MLSKIITQANKAKLKILQEAIGDKMTFFDEMPFYSDDEISYRIECLKSEYQKLLTEIEFLEKYEATNKDKIHCLIDRTRSVRESIAFWGSNNLENIEAILPILEDNHSKFTICAEGLKYYKDGQYQLALQKIEEFLALGGDFFRHYLANKIYGVLLTKTGRYSQGQKYLLRAVQLRPDDIELHGHLCIAAQNLELTQTLKLEKEILGMLKGDACYA